MGTINFVSNLSCYFVNGCPSLFDEGFYLRNPFYNPTGGNHRIGA